MTNILQQFLADRAKRQPVTNDSKPVTREEFNTLVLAVHGLIEDFAVATAPEKMQEAFTNALKPLVDGVKTATNARRPDRGFLAPSDDDDTAPTVANERRPAGNTLYLAPKGD
ncbi:hypothetical protein [Sphingobium ummariense]|uniref:Uncharacterized protein n=1 Tax=Sphingobium ummariense RL-3 TaxID=1346791 RepID=T0K6F3_9SPHN|nr:hypothetical protein [Sphingobium ummariense]EQB32254.1 hypothetical protein M529_10655 [Sphingobium ummariense RL-3]